MHAVVSLKKKRKKYKVSSNTPIPDGGCRLKCVISISYVWLLECKESSPNLNAARLLPWIPSEHGVLASSDTSQLRVVTGTFLEVVLSFRYLGSTPLASERLFYGCKYGSRNETSVIWMAQIAGARQLSWSWGGMTDCRMKKTTRADKS